MPTTEHMTEGPVQLSEAPPAPQISARDVQSDELPGVADFYDLARIVWRAFDEVGWLNYFKTTLGPTRDWLWDRRPLSELDILDLWRLRRALSYFVDVTVPSISGRPDDWLRRLLPTPARELLWHTTDFFHHADPFGHPGSYADERWFFVNGICTNRTMAEINAELISKLFWRPVTVIHNATNSFASDLYECAIGKALNTQKSSVTFTEPALKATVAVLAALCERHIDRVVLIAHSQGTIITANVLRAIDRVLAELAVGSDVGRRVAERLAADSTVSQRPHIPNELAKVVDRFIEPLDGSAKSDPEAIRKAVAHRLRKLEVYTFANCANWMGRPTIDGVGPYLEHFANHHDLVAHFGVLSKPREGEPPQVHIDGPVFVSPKIWGHFLNAHYLLPVGDYLRKPQIEDPYPWRPASSAEEQTPRLYDYYEGARPAAAGPPAETKAAAVN